MSSPAETFTHPRALVLYASKHGHTGKIARHVAQVLADEGVVTDLRDVVKEPPVDLGGYDGVVLVGSVHAGKHQKALVAFVKQHITLLSERPSAFLSVSLTAADDTDESVVTTRDMIDTFLADTGLVPLVTEAVAGSLQYREYDFMTRLLMRVITRKHAEAHDMHHDHDYTDWDRVAAVAAEFAQCLVRAQAPASC
jgi:menaquinone-dependent protoporphyrinogen oxidase